jgi:hypothetical protein
VSITSITYNRVGDIEVQKAVADYRIKTGDWFFCIKKSAKYKFASGL